MISVIVPVYNAENYIAKTIESILLQSFVDYELVIIDDGSQDKSKQICDMYAKKDNRIKVIQKINKGVSSARNLGIENCRGEWICFVDSDDIVHSNYLTDFYNVIKSNKETDLVIASFKQVFNSYEKYFILEPQNYITEKFTEAIKELREKRAFGIPWNKLFRVDIIKEYKLRFNEDLSSYEDELFVLEYLSKAKQITTISDVVYSYNMFDCTSLSRKYIDVEKRIQTADLLYNASMRICFDYHYCKEQYVRHFYLGIQSLYVPTIKFSYSKRKKIIQRYEEIARERGFLDIFIKVLRVNKFHSFNPLLIEGIGLIKFIKHKII